MGYGSYSEEAHRAMTEVRHRAKPTELFGQTACHPAMNPAGVTFRESRDSDEHPHSRAIVFALDVSGSMEDIPFHLASKHLPTFMTLARSVLPSPQVLFLAFGNAYSDASPLQVGQFESTAELMDLWLRRVHLEAGGGGWGESYDLAMHFVARHTRTDCFEKRGQRGYFFMTADEPPFSTQNPDQVKKWIGEDPPSGARVEEVIEALQAAWIPYVLIPDAARAARPNVGSVWRAFLHERCLVLDDPSQTALVAALCIGVEEGSLRSEAALKEKLAELEVPTSERARLVTKLLPLARALDKGPLPPPTRLGTAPPPAGFRG
jgi:hypothetical protein